MSTPSSGSPHNFKNSSRANVDTPKNDLLSDLQKSLQILEKA
jgi:hypothetical protein